MKIAVYSRVLKKADTPYVKQLFETLEDKGIMPYVYLPYLQEVKKAISIPSNTKSFETHEDLVAADVDYLFTLGGDGTILDTPGLVLDSEIPIVGVNLGRLGFLASIDKRAIESAVDSIIAKKYNIDQRTLIHFENNENLFGSKNFALNDFTLSKRDTSSMIVVHAYINGDFLNSYWADGIIVSTPTGSTGYSLSCGGPIVFPGSGNFVITPVAPHNLNVRPIIISDESEITFEIEGRADNYMCTLDSRYEIIHNREIVKISKEKFKINLVRLPETHFLKTIREKLTWGIDTRNFPS